MTQRTLIKELKTESLILGKGYLFEVAQGIYEDKRRKSFILKNKLDSLAKKISEIMGISFEEMCSDQTAENVMPKHIFMAEAWRRGYSSQKNIANYVGLKCRTAVNHAKNSVEAQYDTNKEYKALVDKIRNS